MARHALILAGGSGSRLWPLSTTATPKQLVPLPSGRNLLDIAVERAQAVLGEASTWVVTGEHLAERIVGTDVLPDERVIVEPGPRDTLAAVVLGCAVIEDADPDAVVAVLTADHVIEPVDAFAATLASAFAVAEENRHSLVTLGVEPSGPATGFGYLELAGQAPLGMPSDRSEPGAQTPLGTRPDRTEPGTGRPRPVARFTEKPPQPVADAFFAAGPSRYLWNSGMFVWRASTLRHALNDVAAGAGETGVRLAKAYRSRDADLLADLWGDLPKTSLDYGLMEPVTLTEDFSVVALPLTADWLDLGSWPAYARTMAPDSSNNALSGLSMIEDSRNCVVVNSSDGHVVALVGCDDLIVVSTPRATLVLPSTRAQEVKALRERMLREHPEFA